MEIISKYISEEFLYGIGWTIFHSLWIGAVISLLLFVALGVLNRASARLRYNISIAALISMVIILSLVFTRTTGNARANLEQKLEQLEYKSDLIPITTRYTELNNSMTDIKTDVYQSILNFCNSNYDIVTILWLIGILVMAFRFTGGIIYLERQKKREQYKNISMLEPLTNRIKKRLGIKRKVIAIESVFHKIPATVGILKPVILIPVGALTGIPYNQVEAIIAHELAHIKRHDYLVNIFQSLVEIILFYHPAIWWISSIIRNEREMACDDIAMDISDNKLTYIKALLSISELESVGLTNAVAFTGNNKNLLTRIKKITKMKHNKLNRTDKWTSAVMSMIIIAGLIIVSGFTPRPGVDHSDKAITNITDNAVTIAEPDMHDNIISVQDTNKLSGKVTRTIIDPVDKKEKDATLTFEDGELVKLVVDGKEIPKSDYKLYREIIKETKSDLKDAIADMNDAMEDIDEAMEEIENIDFKAMEMEIRESLREIDHEKIMKEMEESMEQIRESLKDIEIDQRKNIEIHIKNFEHQKKELEKQLIELEEHEAQKNEQIKSEKKIKKDIFN